MIGEQLYLQNRRHLEGALDCTTKEKWDQHAEAVYESLKAFPNHVAYFKIFWWSCIHFKIQCVVHTRWIVHYHLALQYLEQTYSSNERAVPTKLFGLVALEQQLLELTRRSDNWIRRDLEEKTLI